MSDLLAGTMKNSRSFLVCAPQLTLQTMLDCFSLSNLNPAPINRGFIVSLEARFLK